MKRLLFLAVLLSASVLSLSGQDFTNFRIPEKIVSPEFRADTVILRFPGEYASDVRLDGGWMQTPAPMTKREGVWEIKLAGLPGDFYSYRFIVDGVETLDPSNPCMQGAGSEFRNYFILEGARSASYQEARHRGDVSFVWYDSRLIGSNRRMAVYTPYGYNKDKRKQYPVLYLLHDKGDDEESWLNMGRVAQVLDRLIEQGRAVPMIVVMPNCNSVAQASPWLGIPEEYTPRTVSSSVFMSSFINEIIPYVQANYRAIPRKSARAVAGIGTGGTTVINTAVMHPDLFDFVLPLSCGVEENGRLTEDFMRIKRAGIKLFWTGCGTWDTVAYAPSQRLHETLSYIHLDHTFYVMTGGRDWMIWRQFLCNFTPMIFKYYTD